MKEIIIIMGFQGAGKSTLVKDYESQGYMRVNRDDEGGSLKELNRKIEVLIGQGVTKFVLDNTYGTTESRGEVIDLAKRHHFSVKCVWLTTKLEDAQFNVSSRILTNFAFNGIFRGKVHELLGPNGSKLMKSPLNIPSIAIYAYKKRFEEPIMEEGFSAIEEVKFVRKSLGKEYGNKALLLDYDGTLRETKSGKKYPTNPDDIIILPNRKERLQEYIDRGYILLGVSNQSGIEKGEMTEDTAIKCFNRTNDLLGHNFDYQYCPHHSFPIRCYCRKPLSGLGIYFIHKYKLNPSECLMIGDSTSDKNFASRCGFGFVNQEEFFR